MELNLLSVDWDYFMPCLDEYDWGHGETIAAFFELLWTTRVFNRKDKDYCNKDAPIAFDEVKVNQKELDAFMKEVLVPSPFLMKMYVCESHASIWDMMTWVRTSFPEITYNVWNMDAHHDFHYGKKPEFDEEPDCATWAYQGKQHGLINKYRLIYPEWRIKHPEPGGVKRVVTYVDNLAYGFESIQLPKKIDLLFICRSSAWTPSWEDEHWMRLLDHIKAVYPKPWKTKAYSEVVLKPRKFSFDAAKEYHDQTQQQLLKKGVL